MWITFEMQRNKTLWKNLAKYIPKVVSSRSSRLSLTECKFSLSNTVAQLPTSCRAGNLWWSQWDYANPRQLRTSSASLQSRCVFRNEWTHSCRRNPRNAVEQKDAASDVGCSRTGCWRWGNIWAKQCFCGFCGHSWVGAITVRHVAYTALAWLAEFPLTYFLILLLWLLALVLGQLSSLLHEFYSLGISQFHRC